MAPLSKQALTHTYSTVPGAPSPTLPPTNPLPDKWHRRAVAQMFALSHLPQAVTIFRKVVRGCYWIWPCDLHEIYTHIYIYELLFVYVKPRLCTSLQAFFSCLQDMWCICLLNLYTARVCVWASVSERGPVCWCQSIELVLDCDMPVHSCVSVALHTWNYMHMYGCTLTFVCVLFVYWQAMVSCAELCLWVCVFPAESRWERCSCAPLSSHLPWVKWIA